MQTTAEDVLNKSKTDQTLVLKVETVEDKNLSTLYIFKWCITYFLVGVLIGHKKTRQYFNGLKREDVVTYRIYLLII